MKLLGRLKFTWQYLFLSLGILFVGTITPIVMSSCGEQTSKQSDEQGNKQTFVPVTDVKLDNDKLELTVDSEPEQLTATISPNNATNQKIKWTSSDINIAVVDKNGLVKAVGEGNTTITVETEDGKKMLLVKLV